MQRIVHGDCIEVMKTIEERSIDCIVTDPPYGIDYQSAWRTDRDKWKPKIVNDKTPFLAWLPEAYRVLRQDGAMACFVRYDVEQEFREAMKAAGFSVKAQVIWDKVIHGMGDLKGDFAPCHENVIFATKGRFIFPGKRPKSIIRVQRINAEKLAHPNEKPLEVMSYFVDHLSKVGETVLDPFMGVGPTIRAAKVLGRQYIGIECEEKYIKIAETRINEVVSNKVERMEVAQN